MTRRFIILLSAFATALVCRSAHAQDDAARADALFQEARAAVRQGNWEKACPAFAESLRLDPAPGTRINLGECEERSGHLVSAWELYEQAARELAANDPRTPIARQRAAAVDARIPRIVVPEGATVRIGNDPTPKAGELRVDPGRHGVVVLGSSERTLTVTVVERERHVIDTQKTTTPSRSAVAPASSEGTPTRKIAGYATAGVGVATLAVGFVFGGLTLRNKDVVDEECDAAEICSQRGLDAKSDGQTTSIVSSIGVGVGIAALVAGIYLVVSSPSAASTRASADFGGLRVRF